MSSEHITDTPQLLAYASSTNTETHENCSSPFRWTQGNGMSPSMSVYTPARIEYDFAGPNAPRKSDATWSALAKRLAQRRSESPTPMQGRRLTFGNESDYDSDLTEDDLEDGEASGPSLPEVGWLIFQQSNLSTPIHVQAAARNKGLQGYVASLESLRDNLRDQHMYTEESLVSWIFYSKLYSC